MNYYTNSLEEARSHLYFYLDEHPEKTISGISSSFSCIVPRPSKSIIGGCNRTIEDHGSDTTETIHKTNNRAV